MAYIEKTVFISYRRKDVSWALNVYQDLTHKGYDVFFDYKSIASGDFEQIIIGNIKARAHFVMILTPTAFDRCNEPGDWLRREIETAMDEKRNIIPLFFDGFNYGASNVSEKLTGKLKDISRYNGFNVYHDYFQEAMEKLSNQFLNIPLDAILHPLSDEVQEIVRENQVAANKAKTLWQSAVEEKGVSQKAENKDESIRDWLRSLDEDVNAQSVDALKHTDLNTPDWLRGVNGDFNSQSKEKPVVNKIRDKKLPTILPKSKIILSNGMELMRVPAGKFIMGSHLGNDGERSQHTVDIPYDYWMARYAVTNELYNAYVVAKGINHLVPDWQLKKDHPVVNVSWKDAMSYCQWLNSLLKYELPSGLILRLPTEAEWEKSARGTDGREYPWGNQFDKNKCNAGSNLLLSFISAVAYNGTPVTKHSPQGDSPYGCADMIGNVCEWTHSLKRDYPYVINDGREDEKASGDRVLRGGSFYCDPKFVGCAIRNYNKDPRRTHGFRIAVAPPLF